MGINLLIWLGIAATGGRTSRLADALALMPTGRCGSLSAPNQWYPSIGDQAVCVGATGGDGLWMPGVADGAWWQLVTSAFTHVEIWHIATNMLALFILGPPTEQILGRARFLAVYVAGALGGSTTVMLLSDPAGSTVGASGAIFGLLGALLVTFTKARLNTQWITQNLVLGVVITVVGWRFISWQGHLGGLLAGAAAAAIIAFAPKAHRSAFQWTGLGLLIGALLVGSALRAVALA
jgi:membrane associated rhomboid family serine protease